MILQRLANSIRKQDWFTVLIETLIVVLGVFLGLQAQQWAGENQKKATEAKLVSQLHDEIVDLQALSPSASDGAPASICSRSPSTAKSMAI